MHWFMVKLELNYSDMICKPKFKKKWKKCMSSVFQTRLSSRSGAQKIDKPTLPSDTIQVGNLVSRSACRALLLT